MGIQGSASIDLVSSATLKMSAADTAAALAKTALSETEKEEILIKKGLYGEELKAANIIIQKSDEISADVDELHVSGISIWINFDSGCAPKLDITKSYTPL